ncbi:MAG: SpoIID/LytB domain-containing protein [Tissierellia bacterium]|nr:SpoIID/LytB domain-containing protein [Tissierellia bacterium]MDD4726348.1 SpoIID/LytB domain-containing protein [Tissierellia bacterium]
MNKNILLTITILIFIIIPKYSYGADSELIYLDVKVSPNYSKSDYITLSSDEGFNLYNEDDLQRVFLYIPEDIIYIGSDYNGDIIIFDEKNDEIITLPDDGSVVIGSGHSNESIIKVDKNKYRDYIKFLSIGNYINVINHIELEHYLYGVVPKEMGPSFHLEALKAQSIIARSYALANINSHISEGYNFCDTTHCQAYGAYDNENLITNQAVDETYGQYITYNGNIISANYHSNSGGITEDSGNAWSLSLPYLSSVEDVFSNNAPNSSWSFTLSVSDIQSKLAASGIEVGQINNIEILETTEANRVLSLKIDGSKGESTLTGSQLRSLLGSMNLKSTWFTVNKEGGYQNSKAYVISGKSLFPMEIDLSNIYIKDSGKDIIVNRSNVNRARSMDRTVPLEATYSSAPTTFVFNGRGYGHGVGMSQYGASEMANQGYNYEDIITHYYQGVDILNVGR